MIPGDTLNTGHPALWVRAHNTAGTTTAGDIYQYNLTFDTTTKAITGLALNPTNRIGNLTVQAWPTIGAVGDLTGDNIADLWGTTSSGRVTVWPGATADGTKNTPVTGFTSPDYQWLLNPDTQGADAASGPDANPATAVGGVTFTSDHPASPGTNPTTLTGSAHFDGTAGMLGTQRAVRTTGSYTVSAWAKVENMNDWYTIASQTANQRSPFYLQYSKSFNAWAFIGTTADNASTTLYYSAYASTSPTPNQ